MTNGQGFFVFIGGLMLIKFIYKDALEIKQGTIYEIFFKIACGKK